MTIPHSRTSLALAALLLTTACAVGPNYKRPSAPMTAAFKEAPTVPPKDAIGPFKPADPQPAKNVVDPLAVGPFKPSAADPAKSLVKAEPKDDAIRGKWWEAFGDANLNALEEQVAINNQNVKVAEAAFRQARALVGEARAAYFPTIGVSGSMSRSGTGAGASSSTGSTLGGIIHNSYNATGDASWVPDLWGRIRRQVESSRAGAEASAADLASATLSAQAELAIDYLDLRIADEQKRLLDQSVVEFARSLKLTQNQYKVGVAASSDVLQAKVQLETTEAQAVDIGVARAQYEHAIAVLVGKAPADFSIPVIESVPGLPEIPSGVPSQLLERRPDIAGAERRVASANAQIGVAEAAFFPDLTLSASGGYTSTQLFQWFELPTRFWSIGPSLAETLFDAGLRAAQTEAAIAAYDQTVATYRQTVLGAFQTVEDNLAGLRILAEEANVLETAVKDAKASTQVALNQYKAGTVSYLNVVTAQTAQLNDEISALTVRKQRLTDAATLIENLGGGWNADTLRKPEVTQGAAGPFTILPFGLRPQN
jgi:NodT family efflux transporter outer membrane factor (OMF) lipoprotein